MLVVVDLVGVRQLFRFALFIILSIRLLVESNQSQQLSRSISDCLIGFFFSLGLVRKRVTLDPVIYAGLN